MINHFSATSHSKSFVRLGGVAAVVSTIVLLTTGAAQAASASSDTVNGQYCSDLCKVYMSWSNRMMANITPPYARPQVRVAVPQHVPQKKTASADKVERQERMPQHPPKTHRPANLNSFAQLPAGSHAAQSAMEPPKTEIAADEPGAAPAGQLLAADSPPAVPSALADMRRATEVVDMRLVSMTEPDKAQGSITVGEANGSSRSKMPSIWIMLAAAALLAFFGHGWMKRRAAAADGFN
ncbi:hypothetical protein ACVIJ6_002855 [Bradyrhizobium sp. USDA 4369]